MKDEILSHSLMCVREKLSLQKGMNFRANLSYSILLMSRKKNAPYSDRILEDGITIEYEGHDTPRKEGVDPKKLDQPLQTSSGKLTENGKFVDAVNKYRLGQQKPEIVKVYEKIIAGTWSEKGFFELIDYRLEKDKHRKRYIFVLKECDFEIEATSSEYRPKPRSRVIPSQIKQLVWARDNGMCVLCGSKDELHFDHDLPYSLGGTSISQENVRLLCARHNLAKSNKIE